ncbi:MAG: response regulator [Chthoniobacteraceae bacterium]
MNSLSGKSILVIDDDPGMLRALDKVLRGAGADVTSVDWAGDGIEILSDRKKHVDLVITDLRMPFVNGMTVVYAVHQVFSELPVIVLTAYATPETRATCREHNVAAFLEKPLNSEQLIKAVCKALTRSSRRGGSGNPSSQPISERKEPVHRGKANRQKPDQQKEQTNEN